MREIWNDIPGFEGHYQASSFGNIRSLDRIVDRSNGTSAMLNGKVLKLRLNHNGYYDVCLGKKRCRVNRLVWEAFNGPIPEGMQINHKNEIRTDNTIWNLSITTPRQNNIYGHRLVNVSKWVIKLSTNNEILHFYRSARQAELKTGVNHSHISKACQGKLKTVGGFIWKYAV